MLFSNAFLIAGFLATTTVALGQNNDCSVLNDEIQAKTTAYIASRYHIPSTTSLKLVEDKVIDSSCYHRLSYKGTNVVGEWTLILYLSPDLKHLSTDLFNTTVDPLQEAKNEDETLMLDLAKGNFPALGSKKPLVTIVEFVDFQCPYCRQVSEMLQDKIIPHGGGDVRIVFRNLPLTIHPWARLAAEGAACAELQNEEYFWQLHNKLFENQDSITTDNVRQRLLLFAQQIQGIDKESFKTCLDSEMSLGLVLRDMNAATLYKVHATPTLFINGAKFEGVNSVDQILHVVDAARKAALVGTIK